MKVELIEKLDDITNQINAWEKVVIAYIKDSAQPLEDRWEVFCKVPEGMLTEPWVQHHNFGGEEIVWYDDHYKDKYSSVDNVSIIERYEDSLGESISGVEVTQENIDRLKEDMLQSGIRYWENDW